jgi:putative tricarboxylic transport membrane protein
MELLSHLALGLDTALTYQNLGYALAGCLLGTLIGVLPGLGPAATIAMLLPATFALSPESALIMLAGIYYGAQYGGSTTAILVNIPGEASSVMTAIDGHQMAKQGRAGVALFTAGIGSFVAGCVATLIVAAFSGPMTQLAFSFGAAEYFSLMLLGLVGAVVLASGSTPRAIGMVMLGLLLGLVGTDVNSGLARFTGDVSALSDGIGFIAMGMGLFGFAEVILNLERQTTARQSFPIGSMLPTREDTRNMIPAILRGTALGSVLGVLPGAGAALASFASYSLEKRVARHADRFGRGAIQGVAGPESANNAAAQTSFIPMLTLGIPPTPTLALMMGAMMVHNIQPGPSVMSSNPTLFWGLIASMWVGNVMLVILNLPMIGIWVRLLRVPYRLLYPAILVFCCVGAYTVAYSTFDVYVTAAFGIVGYLLMKIGCEIAPMLLGFILGPLFEETFRRALTLSDGDMSVFVDRGLSLGLLLAAAALLLVILLPSVSSVRHKAFTED